MTIISILLAAFTVALQIYTFILLTEVSPDGHPKLLHLWPVKLLQAGQGGL